MMLKHLKPIQTIYKDISPFAHTHNQVVQGSYNWNTSISGVSTSYLDLRGWKLSDGEFFTERDVQTKNKVAVIGKTIVDNLFPNQYPVGQQIRINNTPFKVIGVLTERGKDSSGQDLDDAILAPSTTVLVRLKGNRYIDMIYASAINDEATEKAQAELTAILRESHRINESQENDFVVFNQEQIYKYIG